MDLVTKFRSTIRACLGLSVDPGAPPDLLRLGLYPSTVQVIAADGSKCDIQPVDPRLPGLKNVPVRVSPPGSSAVVQQGAVVLLGWEGGDPAKPYCAPIWYAGATVTTLALLAQTVYLGAQQSAVALALATKVNTELGKIATSLSTHTHSGVTTGPGTSGASSSTYAAGDVSAAQVKGI